MVKIMEILYLVYLIQIILFLTKKIYHVYFKKIQYFKRKMFKNWLNFLLI